MEVWEAQHTWVAGYPVLATGLLILIRGRISGRDRAGLIDAAIIATGLGLLSWTFLMKPIAADPYLLVWGTAALHPSMRSLSEVTPDRARRSPTGGWPCSRRRR